METRPSSSTKDRDQGFRSQVFDCIRAFVDEVNYTFTFGEFNLRPSLSFVLIQSNGLPTISQIAR